MLKAVSSWDSEDSRLLIASGICFIMAGGWLDFFMNIECRVIWLTVWRMGAVL